MTNKPLSLDLADLRSRGAMVGYANAEQWNELLFVHGQFRVAVAVTYLRDGSSGHWERAQITAQQVGTRLKHQWTTMPPSPVPGPVAAAGDRIRRRRRRPAAVVAPAAAQGPAFALCEHCLQPGLSLYGFRSDEPVVPVHGRYAPMARIPTELVALCLPCGFKAMFPFWLTSPKGSDQ